MEAIVLIFSLCPSRINSIGVTPEMIYWTQGSNFSTIQATRLRMQELTSTPASSSARILAQQHCQCCCGKNAAGILLWSIRVSHLWSIDCGASEHHSRRSKAVRPRRLSPFVLHCRFCQGRLRRLPILRNIIAIDSGDVQTGCPSVLQRWQVFLDMGRNVGDGYPFCATVIDRIYSTCGKQLVVGRTQGCSSFWPFNNCLLDIYAVQSRHG